MRVSLRAARLGQRAPQPRHETDRPGEQRGGEGDVDETTIHHGTVPYVRYWISPISSGASRIASRPAAAAYEPRIAGSVASRPRPPAGGRRSRTPRRREREARPQGRTSRDGARDRRRRCCPGTGPPRSRASRSRRARRPPRAGPRLPSARDRRQRGSSPPRTARAASSSTSTQSPRTVRESSRCAEHEVRIEVVVDGDRPERSLGERAREDARREQLPAATEATRPPGARRRARASPRR